jgi:hypothetical protein
MELLMKEKRLITKFICMVFVFAIILSSVAITAGALPADKDAELPDPDFYQAWPEHGPVDCFVLWLAGNIGDLKGDEFPNGYTEDYIVSSDGIVKEGDDPRFAKPEPADDDGDEETISIEPDEPFAAMRVFLYGESPGDVTLTITRRPSLDEETEPVPAQYIRLRVHDDLRISVLSHEDAVRPFWITKSIKSRASAKAVEELMTTGTTIISDDEEIIEFTVIGEPLIDAIPYYMILPDSPDKERVECYTLTLSTSDPADVQSYQLSAAGIVAEGKDPELTKMEQEMEYDEEQGEYTSVED